MIKLWTLIYALLILALVLWNTIDIEKNAERITALENQILYYEGEAATDSYELIIPLWDKIPAETYQLTIN